MSFMTVVIDIVLLVQGALTFFYFSCRKTICLCLTIEYVSSRFPYYSPVDYLIRFSLEPSKLDSFVGNSYQ